MPPPISTSPRPWRRSLSRSRSGTRSTKHPSKAKWHIPRAHYLESWGDARAVGGTLSVVQPLILPLFGGRTPVEVLGLMVGGQDRPGYDIVRETWKPILGEAEFDRKWNRVLHDGFLAGSELPEVVPNLTAQPLAELAPRSIARRRGRNRSGAALVDLASGLEVVFLPSPSLHDGRFANDGWLQELPDPLTKLTWDNPALVSPKTAESLGLANEDWVRLDYAGRSLELPVWLLPGHDGRRGRLDARLRPFARGSDWLGGRVRRVQGPKLQSTWLRQRGHAHQARAHVPALGDPGARQHGGAPRRARVDPDRASIEIRLRQGFRLRQVGGQAGCRGGARPRARMRGTPQRAPKGEESPAHSASSRRTRITSHSGRSMPTIRGTSGG